MHTLAADLFRPHGGNINVNKRIGAAVAAFGLTATMAGVTIPAANAHTTGIHDNCTNFNQKYPHGVGRRGPRPWLGHDELPAQQPDLLAGRAPQRRPGPRQRPHRLREGLSPRRLGSRR